jgi:hypothetical protein
MQNEPMNFNGAKRIWAGPLIIAAVFLFSVFSTWQTWWHPFVDSGIQFYIPWRLNHGAVLYRDIFYFAGGPLSQYFNALLYKIFGVSILTLAIFNLFLIAAMLAIIYRQLVVAANRAIATVACLGIIMVFAFGDAPNFNYVTPYSHEALHGLVLSVFTIALLASWIRHERLLSITAAGFCAGMVFLTKPDIFVALLICVLAAFALFLKIKKQFKAAAVSGLTFFFAGLLPPLFFFFLFLRVENWRESLHSVCFAWAAVQPHVLNDVFYLRCMGLDHPVALAARMCGQFLLITAIVTAYVFLLRQLPSLKSGFFRKSWIAWIFYCAPFLIWLNLIAEGFLNRNNCAASFPLIGLAGCLLIGWNYRKLSRAGDAAFPFLWCVFAFFMLSKMGFFTRIWEYGFILSMPVTVGIVYVFSFALPEIFHDKFQLPVFPLRLLACLILLSGFIAIFAGTQARCWSWKFAIGQGGDRLITGPDIWGGMYDDAKLSPATQTVNLSMREGLKETLAWIQTNVPPDDTLAVFPHGATLNYLSRRVNPTPCLFWDPNVASIFGEARTIVKFQQHPPDYIFFVEWYEYHVGYFGRDYGINLMQWIRQNYHPVGLIGSEPFRNAAFGVKILKRNP